MDVLNIIFGAASVLSLGLAAYQFYAYREKEYAERIKAEALSARLEMARGELRSLLFGIDSIVQRAKVRNGQGPGDPVTLDELQNLGRVCRGYALVLAQALGQEHERLKNWRFGEMIRSRDIPHQNAASAGDNDL